MSVYKHRSDIYILNWIVSGSNRVRCGQSYKRVAERIKPAEIFLGRPSTLSAEAEGPPFYRYDSIGALLTLVRPAGLTLF